MPPNTNVALIALGLLVAAAALAAIVWIARRRRADGRPPSEALHASHEPVTATTDAETKGTALPDNLLAVTLVPAQLRVEPGRVHVDYRLALDNCADQPLVSLRAHIELVTVGGESDPERLGPHLAGPVDDSAPIHLARLDPGEAHQQAGTLTVDLDNSSDPQGDPVVAVVRFRVLAANLSPIISAWVIGKARHQPGARVAAIEPTDLSRGPGVHELLLARQIG